MSFEFKYYRHCYLEVKHKKKVKKKVTFQLPARESLTTPRSARAPIGRRSTSTLPHQRIKKEAKEVSRVYFNNVLIIIILRSKVSRCTT
ncbi:unnamed protein product [Euphydryas editha]|uniref:Uncharacterized protein n=1 Tax=Euphydryas editha TaxID=104508 RepID=A0AAU9THN1_EUPED|nr:unnamed protein product [Euphydryas editha]